MSGCVLDTDVVIGVLDRRDAHHRKASAAVMRMLEQGVALHLCVINYAQALVKPAEAEDTLQQAVDAIASLRIALPSGDCSDGGSGS